MYLFADCPAPTQPNGTVSPTGSAPQGATANITCNQGYTLLNGGAEIACEAGGIWSAGGECLKGMTATNPLECGTNGEWSGEVRKCVRGNHFSQYSLIIRLLYGSPD